MNQHERSKIKRIIGWFEGKDPGPWKIDVELHRRCNLRCLSCSRRSADNYEEMNEHSKEIEMPTEKWLKIIDEAAELGVREWHVAGGGEPLYLPERTLPAMEKIKNHNMYGILTNNGTQFDKEMIKRVIDMGWDVIHFSIDGPNSNIHDYLRGRKRTFKKVTRSIKNFNRIKKISNSKKPEIRVNTVLSNKNYDKLLEMVEYLNELDVSYWFVEPLIVYSDLGEELKLNKEQMKEFKEEYFPTLIEKCREYGIGNNFDSLKGNLENELIEGTNEMQEVVKEDSRSEEGIFSVPCYQPFFHIVIKCNGNVNFCDVFTDTGVNIKDKTLEEAWYGDYMNRVRKQMLNREIPDYCGNCNPSNTTQRRRYREEMKKMASTSKFKDLKEKIKLR